MVTGRAAHDVEHLQNWHTAANELGKCPRKSRHTNLVHERTEHRQLELPSIGKLFTALGAQKGADTENRADHAGRKDVPAGANEITDIDEELRWSWQLGAKILKDFTKNRNNSNDQKCGDGKCNAEHNDGVGHG